jgi:DNA-binding NtrC family response regulator
MARTFAAATALELGRGGAAVIAPRTMEILAGYDWPGNIRQLRNAIERMVVLAPGDELTPDLLPPELVQGGPASAEGAPDLRAAVDSFKRAHIARVLLAAGGNRTKAAEQLGLQRTHLSVLLKKYGLGGASQNEDGA